MRVASNASSLSSRHSLSTHAVPHLKVVKKQLPGNNQSFCMQRGVAIWLLQNSARLKGHLQHYRRSRYLIAASSMTEQVRHHLQ